MKLTFTRTHEIEVPDKATHFTGDLLDYPTFYYMTMINGGEHWWYYDDKRNGWWLYSHCRPHNLKTLEQENLK